MDLDQWLAHQQLQHPDAIALGLDRVRVVAQRLGLTRPATHVITVAGTNGKGSTVAFIDAIARAAGLRVGAYTSPHLLRYNERVRIDGIDADDEALVAAFERIEAARLSPSPIGRGVGVRGEQSVDRSGDIGLVFPSSGASHHLALRPGLRAGAKAFSVARTSGSQTQPFTPEGEGHIELTYFEYGTLAALLLFGDASLDLAILEVGLGGRLDAVNIVDADVSIITTVDLDHQDWLGADRETIGLEKAGVMRAGKPVVLGEIDPPASVLRHAYRIGASAIRAGCDYLINDLPIDPERIQIDCPDQFPPPLPSPANAREGNRMALKRVEGQIDKGWRWREPGYAIDLPEPAMDAPAQRANAAAAIAALRALDLPIPDAAIIEGVRTTRLPARLQRDVRDGVEIVIDVAHNPQAARQLATWLATHPAPGTTFAVFSALGDKDLDGIVTPLIEPIARWWLCGLHDTPRGLSGELLADRLRDVMDGRVVAVLPDVAQALRAARGAAVAGDRILVFGSFHTAADALRAVAAGT